MILALALHHPDCNGTGDERCYGFIAHTGNLSKALVMMLNAGLPADTSYQVRTVGPMPDRWIDPSYWGRLLTAEEMNAIPEPKELIQHDNAEWN